MPHQPLTRDEARRRAALISRVTYDVRLDLTGDGDTFRSTTVARFAAAEAGTATFVDLEAPGVERVELNGREIAADRFNGSRIELDGLQSSNELTVVGRCAYEHTGVGLHRFVDPVDGRVYLHSQMEPFDAHRVFACFDQPDIKAPVTLRVRAPEDWAVVGNGRELSRDADGTRLFTTTPPISPYLVGIVAGPYHGVQDRHRDIDLGVWVRQSLARHLDPEEIIEITRQGFDFFEALFDRPYPFDKYDQLFVPEFNAGAMENPGCVTFAEGYVFRSRVTEASREARAETILHEMAHMWFGDLVTMRWWDDLWLNESFATYMATLAKVSATRFTNGWVTFADQEKAWALRQDQLPSTHPISADIVDTDAVRTNFDGITYAKGAAVLRQLVAWVGDDRFTAALRGYFRRHEFGNAELRDLLAALEETSGRDLGAWAREWLETAGVATLRPEVTVGDDGRYSAFAVVQTAPEQNPTLRSHRLGIGLYALQEDRLVRRHRVELDIVGGRTEVPELVGEERPDLLLVNDGDLTFAKLRLDEHSLDVAMRDLARLDDPLARTLVWSAAWDMTRDAELAARRYVRLVAANAGAERDPGVLQQLLGQAMAAADSYADPTVRPELLTLLCDRARQEMEAAEPGSDMQLCWVRCLASTATTRAQRDLVRSLLDERLQPPGLAVDTELRWHLVRALAAAGAIGESVIDAELETDPTDMGARHAAAARASMPSTDMKRDAWDRLTGESGLPLATTRAMLRGFQQPGQDDVLAAYVERYLEVLPQLWARRGPEEAMDLTRGLYPSFRADATTVLDMADRALDLALPAPARRIIVEARDQTRRAARARAADAASAG